MVTFEDEEVRRLIRLMGFNLKADTVEDKLLKGELIVCIKDLKNRERWLADENNKMSWQLNPESMGR